jgi:group I intron endonuclease
LSDAYIYIKGYLWEEKKYTKLTRSNNMLEATEINDTTTSTNNKSIKTQCDDIIPKKMVGIYGLQNKTTGKWYVGQSINVHDRWNNYTRMECKTQRALYSALVKYGYENFDKIILEECDAIDWILDYREMHWIKYLDSRKNGYNLTDGGCGSNLRGKKSEEHQSKITKALTGKRRGAFSKTAKINMSICKLGENNFWYGKSLSKEHKEKLSKINSGRKLVLSSQELKNRSERARHMNRVKKLKKEKQVISGGTYEKISASTKIRTPPSEEARRKMSEASKNYWANVRLTSKK